MLHKYHAPRHTFTSAQPEGQISLQHAEQSLRKTWAAASLQCPWQAAPCARPIVLLSMRLRVAVDDAIWQQKI